MAAVAVGIVCAVGEGGALLPVVSAGLKVVGEHWNENNLLKTAEDLSGQFWEGSMLVAPHRGHTQESNLHPEAAFT